MSEEIKVGSQVIIHSRHHHGAVTRVVRETKLYWLVGSNERKFRKDTLCAAGDAWGITTISLADPEKIAKINHHDFAMKVAMTACRFDFKKLTFDDLQVISDVLDKYSK